MLGFVLAAAHDAATWQDLDQLAAIATRGAPLHDVLFMGEWPDGKSIRYGVKGKFDPGYGSTSRMLAETAIGLLESDTEGGVGTPGSFLGEALVERLRERAHLTFELEA